MLLSFCYWCWCYIIFLFLLTAPKSQSKSKNIIWKNEEFRSFLCTGNKRTSYYSRGGSEKPNRRTSSGACTQRGVACEDGGWGSSGGDDGAKDGPSCCIARNCNSIAPYERISSLATRLIYYCRYECTGLAYGVWNGAALNDRCARDGDGEKCERFHGERLALV